ncbi:aldehyde dehydrogenase [Aaosphaeria arxii CBS 175.79]|uniref:aldehyde dehydrogenase (NAD(+)) n=1 Tax=Aaosphaeria arxii CBS 175.79 TaxID=1450172 RepID=A0A6A5X7T3_9PLEO|nr:aldehyde dehydrogenase [Aaosphaeria arxii CBS 175.79]KAF2008966.1 aldehyde dehydrogenase [Aaosphaeria arxii CBS 175.79]
MSLETIRTISPVTGEVLLEQPGTTLEQARKITKRSKEAFAQWKSTDLATRKSIVSAGLSLIQKRKEELGRELSSQMGRPIAYSAKEIETMQKRADYLLEIADEALKPIPGKEESGFKRCVKKEPVGPVLIVFAWNFPYLILVNSLIPALLSGNSVIIKPSPQTPLVGTRIVEIFTEAGFPQNVLQVIQTGDPNMLEQLVKLPKIQQVTFTGSTAVGIKLREATAGRIIPLGLELGGNDPAYVRQDVYVKYVAAQLVDGAVFNTGQSCCSIERVYVHDSVHDELVQEMQNELSIYKVGDPFDQTTTVGPAISAAAVKSIKAQIDDALSKGALDATPANPTFQNLPLKGSFIAPRILTNANHTMAVMRDETFGPVIPVCKVSSDEEAIALMNDSDYGLTASVWTKDISRGEEIIDKLEAGTVFLNRADYPNPDLAWTGWKNSGLGCTLGPKGFDAFYKLKSWHVKMV